MIRETTFDDDRLCTCPFCDLFTMRVKMIEVSVKSAQSTDYVLKCSKCGHQTRSFKSVDELVTWFNDERSLA